MDAPNKITVLIEPKDTTESAKLIKYDSMYNAAEYEADDGSRFYVEMEYLATAGNSPIKIPLEVITQLKTMRQKLAEAQAYLDKDKKNGSKLILPPGYSH